MKVLMVGNAQSVKGGITTVISQFINHNWSEQIKLKFIPTYTDKNWIIKIFFFTKAYIRILLNFIFFKPDIVHIHMSYKGSFTRAKLIQNLCLIFDVKNIIHLHGSQFEKWYYECNKIKKNRIRKLIRNANLFVVLGREWKRKIQNIESNTNIEIIQNSIKLPPKNLKAKYSNDNFTLLYLGVLVERKGISDLIETINNLVSKDLFKNVKLLIAGDGEQSTYLKEKVKKLNLSNYIKFLGWIDKEQKEELLKNSQALILPSYNEGLPMCVLEAMSYGLPILSTNVGDVSEAVQNLVNGFLFQPGNIVQIEDSLTKMINISEKAWNEMSNESMKIINKKFSESKYFLKFEKCYYSVLEKEKGINTFIYDKKELKQIINLDKKNYLSNNWLRNFYLIITNNKKIQILNSIIVSRKYNYYVNHRNGILNKLKFVYYTRKNNNLNRKNNIEIYGNFGKNLKIYHSGVIFNKNATIGNNVIFHGFNCVGNKSNDSINVPKIGNNVEIGFGSIIIGNIEIADGIKIGANTLVNKSFLEENITIVGNPAKKI